jgi:hypothetical protein
MVYRHISKDLKERALWLLEHNYIPSDVGEIFGVSERSLQRWRATQAEYGTVVPPPLAIRGRHRILNSDMTHDLFAMAFLRGMTGKAAAAGVRTVIEAGMISGSGDGDGEGEARTRWIKEPVVTVLRAGGVYVV